MTKSKPIPKEIRNSISYNPETGTCRWLISPARRVKVGDEINCQTNGYKSVRFKGVTYRLHRVIWFLHYGEQPGDLVVDHKDGDRTNNKIENLRLVTHQENLHNTKATGISFHKKSGKWRAQIACDGINRYLGLFDCPILAGLAYKEAKRQLHPTALR